MRSVIQSVFYHLSFLIGNTLHPSPLRQILAHQFVEVLITSTLSAFKGSGKVACTTHSLVNPSFSAKFFAIVIVQGFNLELEKIDDSRAPPNSDVLFETFAMKAYPLLRFSTASQSTVCGLRQ